MLLLDEPLGALDLKLRRSMQIEIKRIQTEVGLTFIHVTHDQEEAMTMADTIAVMNAGVIEQMGAPDELYENPQHDVRGQLPRPVQPHRGHRSQGRDGDFVKVDMHGIDVSIPADRAHARADGDAGWVGIRPEKVLIGEEGEALDAPGNTHPGRRRQRRQLRRREHAVPRADAVGPGAPGLRAEHRAPAALPAGRAGRAVLAS